MQVNSKHPTEEVIESQVADLQSHHQTVLYDRHHP